MNVVNLVILLGNAVCVLVLVVMEMDGVEALAPGVVGVQVMGLGAGVIALVGECLHGDAV